IANVSHCALSLKSVLDQWVTTLLSLKEQSIKAERDYQSKLARADTHISSLRSDIAALVEQKREAEHSLQLIRHQIEKEQKEIGLEKAKLTHQIDQWLAAQPQA